MSLKSFEEIINLKALLFKQIHSTCVELLEDPIAFDVKNYIDKRLSKESQKKFGIGYFPDDQNLDILINKIGEKKLKYLNLIYPYYIQENDYKSLINKSILSNHNLIFPYKDIYGNIKSFIGRTLLSEEDRKSKQLQKYKYSKFNQSLLLYGLYEAKESIIKNNCVCIVEGQIDCITCHEYGYTNVVALGGSSLTKRRFQLLTRYTDNINLMLDSDFEGKKAQEKIIKNYNKYANIKSINLPGNGVYKDIDEYLRHSSNKELLW